MDYIIEEILNFLKKNNISVYSLAKSAKISQSTLHMILHFERKMKPKQFYSIMDNLPMSLDLKKELTQRFQQITLGSVKYDANICILDMLKEFSNLTFSQNENKFPPPHNTLSIDTFNAIYKGYSIQSVISRLLINEMAMPKGEIYVYIPGDNATLNSYIDSIIKQYETDLAIVYIIDFLNSSSESNNNYNLKILQNILPLALSSSDNYNFYYTYVDSIINDSYITPYPYFIALSEKIIWINSSVDEIMVINDKDIAKNLITMCEGKLLKYKKLLDINSDVHSIVNSIVENQGEITTHYCIEYEPCLSMYFTKEMIDAVIPENIEMREQLLTILFERYEQLNKIEESIQIFNKNSILEFAKTGVIKEFPSGYSRPCTKSERLYILNCLLNNIQSNKHIIRAINPVNLYISDCLSLIIEDEVFLQFSVWNDRKTSLKYLAINEQTLCKYFYDFIKNLLDTNMLYTKERTITVVREAIDYIK